MERTIETPLGVLRLTEKKSALVKVEFAEKMEETPGKSTLLNEAERQIKEYFRGEREVFHLPIYMEGTPFEMQTWEKLREIPYGETRDYSDIAQSMGRPQAARAVGMACRQNKLLLIVPCHRAVGRGGSLSGYTGGIETKKTLLEMEKHGLYSNNY